MQGNSAGALSGGSTSARECMTAGKCSVPKCALTMYPAVSARLLADHPVNGFLSLRGTAYVLDFCRHEKLLALWDCPTPSNFLKTTTLHIMLRAMAWLCPLCDTSLST